MTHLDVQYHVDLTTYLYEGPDGFYRVVAAWYLKGSWGCYRRAIFDRKLWVLRGVQYGGKAQWLR